MWLVKNLELVGWSALFYFVVLLCFTLLFYLVGIPISQKYNLLLLCARTKRQN